MEDATKSPPNPMPAPRPRIVATEAALQAFGRALADKAQMASQPMILEPMAPGEIHGFAEPQLALMQDSHTGLIRGLACTDVAQQSSQPAPMVGGRQADQVQPPAVFNLADARALPDVTGTDAICRRVDPAGGHAITAFKDDDGQTMRVVLIAPNVLAKCAVNPGEDQ